MAQALSFEPLHNEQAASKIVRRRFGRSLCERAQQLSCIQLNDGLVDATRHPGRLPELPLAAEVLSILGASHRRFFAAKRRSASFNFERASWTVASMTSFAFLRATNLSNTLPRCALPGDASGAGGALESAGDTCLAPVPAVSSSMIGEVSAVSATSPPASSLVWSWPPGSCACRSPAAERQAAGQSYGKRGFMVWRVSALSTTL